MVNDDRDASPPVPDAVLASDSPEATRRLGRLLGEACRGGEVLLLHGDLGSGKTCLVQGLAAGLGVDASLRVTSPTFVLHAEYPGRLVLNHLDLYRLDVPAALAGLGLDDFMGRPGGVTAVEWPELLDGPAAGGRLEIRIADAGGGGREFALSAFGPAARRLAADWTAAAQG